MWNEFVIEYAKSPGKINNFHRKYQWYPESTNITFDTFGGKGNVLMFSTETESDNIFPNVTFDVQVNLQAEQVEFVLIPNLEEGTKYRMTSVNVKSMALWKVANQVYNR